MKWLLINCPISHFFHPTYSFVFAVFDRRGDEKSKEATTAAPRTAASSAVVVVWVCFRVFVGGVISDSLLMAEHFESSQGCCCVSGWSLLKLEKSCVRNSGEICLRPGVHARFLKKTTFRYSSLLQIHPILLSSVDHTAYRICECACRERMAVSPGGPFGAILCWF